MQINSFNHPSFKGSLKQNLAIGESVVREFGRAFPHVKSSSFLSAKIYKLQQRNSFNLKNISDVKFFSKYSKRKKLINSLKDLFCRWHESVFKTNRRLNELFAPSTRELVRKWEVALKQCECFVNCGEINQMLALKMRSEFKNITFVEMNIVNKKNGKSEASHLFVLLGMKKDGKCQNPSTWGENAVIIDGWAKMNMRAQDALEYYKGLFSVDKKCHSLQYKSMDEYLKIWEI